MTIEMIQTEEFNQGTQIKVIGVGGGGVLPSVDGGMFFAGGDGEDAEAEGGVCEGGFEGCACCCVSWERFLPPHLTPRNSPLRAKTVGKSSLIDVLFLP